VLVDKRALLKKFPQPRVVERLVHLLAEARPHLRLLPIADSLDEQLAAYTGRVEHRFRRKPNTRSAQAITRSEAT
jgi:hypothetical protein